MAAKCLRALLLISAASAAGAVGAQRVYAPAQRWVVDGGDTRCSLGRRLGDDNSPILLLSSYLGRDEPQFLLLRDGSQPLPNLPAHVSVVLSPGERSEEVSVRRSRGGDVTAVVIEGLKEGFFDRFGMAESVSFRRGDHIYFTMQTPQAARALAVLKQCNDTLFRSWGIDTAARDTWQRQPKQIAGSLQDTDYPGAAVSANQQGDVVARLNVEADGHLSGCTVVVRAPFEALNEATCRLIMERFRYDPALDAQGRAIATPVIRTVSWRLPD